MRYGICANRLSFAACLKIVWQLGQRHNTPILDEWKIYGRPFKSYFRTFSICNVIKQNESELANTDIDIKPIKRRQKINCFAKPSIAFISGANQLIFTRSSAKLHWKVLIQLHRKQKKMHMCDFRLILSDCITFVFLINSIIFWSSSMLKLKLHCV